MKDPDDTAWRDMVSGCYGAYEYSPDLFRPGVRLSVRVFLDDRTEAEDFRESRPASSPEMSPRS